MVTYFREIKHKWMDKKEDFIKEIVKTGLAFAAIQYAVLKFTYHRYFAHAQLKL